MSEPVANFSYFDYDLFDFVTVGDGDVVPVLEGSIYLLVLDAFGDAPFTYQVKGGDDEEFFFIEDYGDYAELGFLYEGDGPYVDNPVDEDGDNIYEVTIRIMDVDFDGSEAHYTDIDLFFSVYSFDNGGGGDNEAPVLISPDFFFAPENSDGVVYTAVAIDDDGDEVIYLITGGADADLFTIDPLTGEVSFLTPPDYEQPSDADFDNEYEIEITAFDQDNGNYDVYGHGYGGGDPSDPLTVIISVTDENDNAPVITSGDTATAAENTDQPVYDAEATDADADSIVTFLITGGADGGQFYIDETTGELYFSAPPDFELPGDADGDNFYEIEITATDGDNYSEAKTIIVEITDANDNAPVITSGDTATVGENTFQAVYQTEATDDDISDVLEYILGGPDQAFFSMDPATGEVWLEGPLDFEAYADADGNNIYVIEITAFDGENYSEVKTVEITLENENDTSPVITSGDADIVIPENSSDPVYTAVASDADGDDIFYTLGGDDADLFYVDSDGTVWMNFAPDHEAPDDADGDNVYLIEVYASDGTYDSDPVLVSITVTDENEEPPVITSTESSVSVAENTTSTGFVAEATDPDGDDVKFFIIGGADAALFTIDEDTGELSFVAPPDFENPSDAGGDNVYDVEIVAQDGTFESDTFAVSVEVTDVPEGSVILGTPGPDTLIGTATDDTMMGLAGNDTMRGSAGGDTLYGGDGSDWVHYNASSQAVTVDLAGVGSGGDAEGDTYNSIENVRGSAHNDTLIGDASNNVLLGGAGADAMDGRGGSDWVYYWGSAAVTVNLATGEGHGGDAEGDTYTSIENVQGSDGNDTLIGDANSNAFVGRGGADTMDGGAGSDWVYYWDATAGITANLTTGRGTGGVAEGDRYTSIENLRGSEFGDTLIGNAEDNVLAGYGGNDVLRGQGGADTLNGGDGNDWAYYWGSAAVTVNLATGTGTGGHAEGDVYISVENVQGSDHGDVLIGDAGNNALLGRGGADTLDGGDGLDWVYYWDATAGITANLATGTGSGNVAEGDVYISIENIRGSNFDDVLIGDENSNVLRGDLGNDTLDGGLGSDTFAFHTALNPSSNVDTIVGFTIGEDTIHLDKAIFSALGAPGALSSDAFTIGADASDASHRIVYDDTSGALFYDSDGAGGVSQVQFAVLDPHLSLTNGSFFII